MSAGNRLQTSGSSHTVVFLEKVINAAPTLLNLTSYFNTYLKSLGTLLWLSGRMTYRADMDQNREEGHMGKKNLDLYKQEQRASRISNVPRIEEARSAFH